MFKILLSISLLAPLVLEAQTAQDYFHRGAQFYIWNQKQKATNEIYTGLSLFPTDPPLNGLAALIKKEEEQKQNQQQQQEQQQQDQQKDQSKQDQNQQQQSQQSQQNQAEQNQNKQDQKDEQSKQDQQQQQAAQKSEEDKQKQSEGAQGAQSKEQSDEKDQQAEAAGQLTPDQARQLLDAQKADEKMLPPRPEGKPLDRSKPFRDW